ncbi:tyrosine-type recombinase/integrase [Rhodoferax sp.]|uniref:tyrosine-type recombinase/integrase n=1 Tax=Rhodoferax sp. TaxID=50421 RepID=UPI00374DF90E
MDYWKKHMSRYADINEKSKKWTPKALEAIKPDEKGEILREVGGLVGEVRVSSNLAVSINFRFAFKWEGKKIWHYCGTWPATSMADIRRSRDEARRSVAEGINPNDQRKAVRIEAQAKVEAVIAESARVEADGLPFQKMFEAWLIDGVARADGNSELRRAFEKDVLPAIGKKPVREITEHDLRALLRAMVKRGVSRMTTRVYNDLVQLFAWAEKRQPWRTLMIEGNAADLLDIDRILPLGTRANSERTRIFSPDEIRELRDIFTTMENDYRAAPDKRAASRPLKTETQIAMWICLSTACRIGELLQARWEHLQLDSGVWRIPVENTKQVNGEQQDHIVYLSEFASRQFESLRRTTTEDSNWCFPARNATVGDQHVCIKSVSKQIGDRQMQFKTRKPLKNRKNDNSLVIAKGKNGEWTPHDLRRTAATMMQSLGVSLDVIDRCQNHVIAGSKVRRHYLHYDYAKEKADAWRMLGKRIEAILAAATQVT